MRYTLKVADIENYELGLLKDEIRSAGLPLEELFAANSALTLVFPAALSAAELITLRNTINAHAPTWYTWVEDGETKKARVRCAEDIDRITAARIRRAIGGHDAVQEQLKQLRTALWAHEIRIQVLEGRTISQADKNKAGAVTNQLMSMNSSIETFREEGKAFKQSKGW